MLFHVHRGRLARGAHDADAVGAFSDVPVDQFAQGGVVHAAVFVHGVTRATMLLVMKRSCPQIKTVIRHSIPRTTGVGLQSWRAQVPCGPDGRRAFRTAARRCTKRAGFSRFRLQGVQTAWPRLGNHLAGLQQNRRAGFAHRSLPCWRRFRGNQNAAGRRAARRRAAKGATGSW